MSYREKRGWCHGLPISGLGIGLKLGFFCHGAPREHVQAFRCTTGLQVGPPWAFPSAQKQQFITEPSRIKAVLVARPLGPFDARAHPQAPGGRTRGPRVWLGASQLYLQKAGGGARRVNVLCSLSSSGLSAVMHRLSKVMV